MLIHGHFAAVTGLRLLQDSNYVAEVRTAERATKDLSREAATVSSQRASCAVQGRGERVIGEGAIQAVDQGDDQGEGRSILDPQLNFIKAYTSLLILTL